jgi:hypothetical protein
MGPVAIKHIELDDLGAAWVCGIQVEVIEVARDKLTARI